MVDQVTLARAPRMRRSRHLRSSAAFLLPLVAAACSLGVAFGRFTRGNDDRDASDARGAGAPTDGNGESPPPTFREPRVVASEQTGAFEIASDATAIYWLTRGANEVGAVMALSVAGGDLRPLA